MIYSLKNLIWRMSRQPYRVKESSTTTAQPNSLQGFWKLCNQILFSLVLFIFLHNFLSCACTCTEYTFIHGHICISCVKQRPTEHALHRLSKAEVNPMLHSNISKHILCTVLYTFLKVLTRRICLIINSFINWWSLFIIMALIFDSGVVL